MPSDRNIKSRNVGPNSKHSESIKKRVDMFYHTLNDSGGPRTYFNPVSIHDQNTLYSTTALSQQTKNILQTRTVTSPQTIFRIKKEE